MPLYAIILLVTFVESLVAFSGGLLAVFNEERVRRAAHYIVSFAIGALLGVAFLELIPEAAEISSAEAVLPWALGGIIIFFVLEKFLFWYHSHNGNGRIHPYAYLVLWGDFLHNFLDGVVIALAFLVDLRLGFITSLAVVLHEIPQEVSDFGVLIHAGFSRARALAYNFFSATSVMIGAMLTYAFGDVLEPFLPVGLALTAGFFIYLAVSDLMPELHEKPGFRHGVVQVFFIVVGVALVILPEYFLGH